MCNLSNFWLLNIIVCCCTAMQNARMCEEVLAAGSCFLPLVPASFYFAMPSLLRACLRMQMGLVKGPGRRFPMHHVWSHRGGMLQMGFTLHPLCCSLGYGSVRGWDASAAKATFHRRGGKGPLLFGSPERGSSMGASCPRCSWGWHVTTVGHPGCTWWHHGDRHCCHQDAWLHSEQA